VVGRKRKNAALLLNQTEYRLRFRGTEPMGETPMILFIYPPTSVAGNAVRFTGLTRRAPRHTRAGDVRAERLVVADLFGEALVAGGALALDVT